MIKKLILGLLVPFVFLSANDTVSITPNYKTPNGTKLPIKIIDNKDGSYNSGVYSMGSYPGSKILDSSLNEAFNTIFGEVTTGERTDNINVQFQYNNGVGIDTLESVTGTGYSDNNLSMAQIHTGAGIGSTQLRSKDTNRYITGHDLVAMFTTKYSIPQPNTYQRHVYGDDNDYVGFGYNGTTFGIWKNFNGDVEHIPQSNWNGNIPSGWTLNPQKLNIYWVTLGWLGIAPIQLKVYGGTHYGWITVHTFNTPNVEDKPHLGNPVLPIQIEVGRTSGTGTDLIVSTASWRAGIVGKEPKSGSSYRNDQIFVSKTISAGVVTPIITISNNTTFQGKINHVKAKYGTVNISTDGTKAVKFRVCRNGNLTGGTFVDFNTTRTPLSYNITATSYNGCNLIGGTLSGKVDTQRINLFGEDVEIPIYPGESVTLTGESSNASDIELFFRARSEF